MLLAEDRSVLCKMYMTGSVPSPGGSVYVKSCFTAAGVARMQVNVNVWDQRTGFTHGSTFRNTARQQTHQTLIALLLPPRARLFSLLSISNITEAFINQNLPIAVINLPSSE